MASIDRYVGSIKCPSFYDPCVLGINGKSLLAIPLYFSPLSAYFTVSNLNNILLLMGFFNFECCINPVINILLNFITVEML